MEKAVVLQCIIYKDGDMYTSLCLDLDVASCGETEEDAKKYLQEAIDTYVEYAVKNNKVEELILSKVRKHRSIPKKQKKQATSFRPRIEIDSIMAAYC
ncbi:hypothetical protein OXPF_05850 [Oxobacter pfennigii]|uniref:HicB-like antitoxin of toxin-antitoxin system domain-containing protein n=1 Tax=Oxobacter pfennigii TaxID=36849 RepID=A0A0P8WDF7_9CLOT|nr:hypothetical protein [Oxobacter pfennigii]KPU45796.1 hypothetical protein OXPF_05850 [Oxobacter pfennigii]